MKTWYRILIVVSLLMLGVTLCRAEFLRVPHILSATALVSSFVVLFAGFLAGAMCWKGVLVASGYPVSGASCIAGMGLAVFGKYVPGKIWTIAGRAAYTAQQTGDSLPQLTAVSLKTQLLEIWTGIVFGTIGLCAVGGLRLWGWPAVLSCVLLAGLLFSPAVQMMIVGIGCRLLRKEVATPTAGIKATLAVVPWFVLAWGLWMVAFYLLARSLVQGNVPWNLGFAFPLACTLGVLAIVMPGGLGVREGVLTGYLVLAGIPVADATTVAVASRLWFLIGELFMFTAGVVANRLETARREQRAGRPQGEGQESRPRMGKETPAGTRTTE